MYDPLSVVWYQADNTMATLGGNGWAIELVKSQFTLFIKGTAVVAANKQQQASWQLRTLKTAKHHCSCAYNEVCTGVAILILKWAKTAEEQHLSVLGASSVH